MLLHFSCGLKCLILFSTNQKIFEQDVINKCPFALTFVKDRFSTKSEAVVAVGFRLEYQ